MTIAILTFSERGAALALQLTAGLPESRAYVHANVKAAPSATRFDRAADLVAELFYNVRGLVVIGPCGVVVRAIAPLIKSKYTDPAVVVMDVGARHVISLLSGHEGGANTLAMQVANLTGAEPVITTTTEAERDLIVGIGCRKGIPPEAVETAVLQALASANVPLERVRLLTSVDIKRSEAGLLEAARRLDRPLLFLSTAEIRKCRREFAESATAKARLGLPAVAEPCALLAGKRTELILRRQVCQGVTVAIAKESMNYEG